MTDVEAVAGQPQIAYVGTGGGGLWKTVNGGTTWKLIFERQNTNTIRVGTGEANPRNSVSFGDGARFWTAC